MPRLPERIVALAPDERLTLATCRTRRSSPSPSACAAPRRPAGSTSPTRSSRRWMSSRRDALLTADSDDGELALIARLLSDALDAAAAQ